MLAITTRKTERTYYRTVNLSMPLRRTLFLLGRCCLRGDAAPASAGRRQADSSSDVNAETLTFAYACGMAPPWRGVTAEAAAGRDLSRLAVDWRGKPARLW